MPPSGAGFLLTLFSALALGGAPVAATERVAPAPAEVSAALARAQAGDCPGALQAIEPALPLLTGRERTAAQLIRITCLGATGRGGEVPAIYQELRVTDPENPVVKSLGVFVAAAQDDFPMAARRLTALAEQNPDGLDTVTGELWRGIAQKLTEQGRFDLRDQAVVALARADWQPADRPELAESVVQGAVEALMKTKAMSEAETLLPRITMPGILTGMATERSYAPLWPAIETALGPHSARAVDRYAADRLEALARMPDDPAARHDAIRAFIMLGRYADAVEIAAPIRIEDGMDEKAISSIRLEAQALAALGEMPRAIDRMRGFAALDPARSPEAGAGMVALAELLDEAGRPAEALQAARAAAQGWRPALSRWGLAWLQRTEVCALHALGNRAEETRLADALRDNAQVNEPAAIEALLCAGRLGDAAKIATATLATAEGASNLSDQFQPEAAMWAPSGSRLRALWVPLLARPDVRKAFDLRLRILPKSLWPAREPRPIPRTPAPEGTITA